MEPWLIERLKDEEVAHEVQIPLFYEEPIPVESNSKLEETEERGILIIDYSSGTVSTG